MTSSKLSDTIVALSISTAPDMERLGYPDREVDRVLFSVCGAVIREGGRIAYSGNLDSDGYSYRILHYVAGAYTKQGFVAPVVHFLVPFLLREYTFKEVWSYLAQSVGFADVALVLENITVRLFSVDEDVILVQTSGQGRTYVHEAEYDTWVETLSSKSEAEQLTGMRLLVSSQCIARVAMGGKMGLVALPSDHYRGKSPGIAEECTYTIQERNLPIVLGAFGGAARDIAVHLDLLGKAEAVSRGEQVPSYNDAMNKLGQLQANIPDLFRPSLESLALEEDAEAIGYLSTALISEYAIWKAENL